MKKTSIYSLNGVGRMLVSKRLYYSLAFTLLGLSALLTSCSKDSTPVFVNTEQKLTTAVIKIDGHTATVECAVTSKEKNKGLMFRKTLPENKGMLFYYEKPQKASFWMKNTFIPLSIALIDQEGVISEIRKLQPLDTTPVYSQSYLIKYALEMNQGWFEERGIKPGDVIKDIPDLIEKNKTTDRSKTY